MRWGRLMERKSVTVKFDGDLEEVAVEDFVSVVLGYSRVLQAAAREVSPNIRLDVNITSTRAGCLEAILSAIAKDGPGLLAAITQTSDQLGTVIGTANGYLDLRKALGRGGAPKEIERTVDGVVITAGDNSEIHVNNYVYNLAASPAASDAAASMFSIDEENENIRSISISAEDTPRFVASKEEFPQIKAAPDCEVGSERKVFEEGTPLTVLRPVLAANPKRKWELYWRGVKVSANVTDPDLFERLTSHEWVFGIGDTMVADLEITQRRSALGIWENKGYRVTKVYDVVSQGENERLDL